MIRFRLSAGLAALVVSLATVFAPVRAPRAEAQPILTLPDFPLAPPAAEEIVPEFVTRAVVQATGPAEAGDPPASSLAELVRRQPVDAPLDDQLRCLAGAVFFEARGEPLVGQLAVAEVIVNRAASGRFPASYCGVVMQKGQFSFVRNGRMPAIPGTGITWKQARAIARIAHQELWNSEADGALFFHARTVAPAWGGRHRAAARIHNHVFYR